MSGEQYLDVCQEIFEGWMNSNQFSMVNSIVNGVEGVDILIMSILHSHVVHRN